MTVIPRDQSTIYVDGSKASYVACPEGQQITLANVGNTLYYKTTSDVTSSSNDGNIATAASASFTSGQYVICAQGVGTSVLVKTTEGDNANFRVGGNLAVVGTSAFTGATAFTGAVTQTGGITPTTAPLSIPNWWPSAVTSGTDTTPADGTLFLTSITPPVNFTATGVGYVLGTIGGTDRVVVNLWSAAGVNLAQSTTASNGTVAGTTATYQKIDFTATVALTAGTRYFIGVAAKGNNCRLRTVPVGADLFTMYAGSVAQTHAATTTISPPSGFTADKAPVCFLY